MCRKRFTVSAAAYVLGLILGTGSVDRAAAADWKCHFLAGYAGGPGGQIALAAGPVAPALPLALRFGIGCASREAGKAGEARRIFINDADNGTPEKHGHDWVWRFDLVAPVAGSSGWAVHAGPRYSRFTANFKYVGGNEDFDVRCGQWGLGGGAEYAVPVDARVELRAEAGVDYYFAATLEGHDTAYSPDGDHVNPREGYGYTDADRAIGQPKTEWRLMVGAGFRLGGD
jgi:hypothetical protein